jgi:competence protein ComEC
MLAGLALGALACGPATSSRPPADEPLFPGAREGRLVPYATPPPPAPGAEVDLWAFDVGTGLAMLLRGADFTLLYDGGSNDDLALGAQNRLLAYLEGILGASGGPGCRPGDDEARPERRIDHVVLSHPHRDHVELLPDVLRCYAVANVWDSGAEADTGAYAAFAAAIAAERGALYHSARPAPEGGLLGPKGAFVAPARWRPLREGEAIALGQGVKATVLRVRYDVRDPNDASIVLRIDAGRASLLFTGDVTAGARGDNDAEPAAGSGEADLLSRHRAELDVDVLQVAHHGSRTSSRGRFLDAVTPRFALVSSGPMRYGPVVLPDADVIGALVKRGVRVLRTDDDDEGCKARGDKVGPDADGRPGGCSAHHLHVSADGEIREVSP